MRAQPHQVRVNARQFVEQHPDPLRLGRNLKTKQFLYCKRVTQIVGKRAEIVDAIREWHYLLVELGFARFLDSRVQVPNIRHDPHNIFAIYFQDHAQHSVGGRMLRSHVQDHGAILPGLDHWHGSQVGHNEA